jgi:cytochrome c oxidase assembly factor CtaG
VTTWAHVEDGGSVPAISLSNVFTTWVFEPLALSVILATGLLYGAGILVLRRRGDAWPRGRSASFFVGGLGALALATSSSLAAYDDVLLSMHMVQHMVLSMVAPIFLALGSPVTLALRTLPASPRAVLLKLLHSRLVALLAFAPVAFALFIVSPWVLYFSGLYEATLNSEVLHNLLHVHFVLVGSLFFWPLLGLDPVPGRVAYPFRLLTVFATLPFHAFLGVTIMAMETVIAADWYFGLDRHWPPSPLEDQGIAGGILWGSGDLVALVIFGVLFVQWVRESAREAAREDRRLDRAERAHAGSPTKPATVQAATQVSGSAPGSSDGADSR